MPLRRAGIGHGLHGLVFGRERRRQGLGAGADGGEALRDHVGSRAFNRIRVDGVHPVLLPLLNSGVIPPDFGAAFRINAPTVAMVSWIVSSQERRTQVETRLGTLALRGDSVFHEAFMFHVVAHK